MRLVFARVANAVAYATGRPLTFLLCCGLVVVWAATGPVFRFFDTWQLVINTGTTIVTFLMIFPIQNTQNREGAALQAKLDEIIRVLEKAESRFIGLERRDEDQNYGASRRACADHRRDWRHAADGCRRNPHGAFVTAPPLALKVTEPKRNRASVEPLGGRQIPDELWRRHGVGLEQRRSSSRSGLDHPMHNHAEIRVIRTAG